MSGTADEDVWTKEEDLAIMLEAQARNCREWVKVAEAVRKSNGGQGRRTPLACLRRFQRTLNTKLVTWSRWREEEHRMLVEAVKVS